MGLYINHDSKGEPLPHKGKAAKLIEDGATPIDWPTEWQENMVCVVKNALFEAAGYLFSENEMNAFLQPCGRPKTFLIYPHAKTLAK